MLTLSGDFHFNVQLLLGNVSEWTSTQSTFIILVLCQSVCASIVTIGHYYFLWNDNRQYKPMITNDHRWHIFGEHFNLKWSYIDDDGDYDI